MRIALIAEQSKRELLQNFCISYKLLLRKHTIFAPELTARKIEEVGIAVEKFLPANLGGGKQLISQIERNEIDAVIYFYSPQVNIDNTIAFNYEELIRVCDEYLIPIATNIGTAELLILGIDHGDLDWRL